MNKQLGKEKVVRQAIAKVHDEVQRLFLILDSMIIGNPSCMRISLADLSKIIQPLLHAPLTAPFACRSWILMSQCLEEDIRRNGLGERKLLDLQR